MSPWQRQVWDVAGELADDGRRWYDTVIIEVPRQAGKTWGIEANNTDRANSKGDNQGIYAAQNRLMARTKILDDYEAKRLARCVLTRGRYKPILSNGREGIQWANGSKLSIISNTSDAGHSLAEIDDVALDEAFAHEDLTVITALGPTMLASYDPQLIIASAVGDGTDGLLLHFEEVGVYSLADPGTHVAYFKWAAPDGVDHRDPAVWVAHHPGIGTSTTVEAIRRILQQSDQASFERTILNRRPTFAQSHIVDEGTWARQLDVDRLADLAPPYVAAFDVHHERSSAAIAVCGTRPGGGLGVVVEHRPDVSWLTDAVHALRKDRSLAAVWADRRAGAGVTINRLSTS
jgi:phage terminase large subunit-like protein